MTMWLPNLESRKGPVYRAIADAIDRRRMMQITELAFAAASAALVANALLPNPKLWVKA